jgi:hypothetical protein
MKRTLLFLILLALGVGSQSAFALPPPTAPDGGSTMFMLGVGVTGLAWVTKRLRR